VSIKVDDLEAPVEMDYVVQNFLCGPDKGVPVSLSFAGQMTIEVEADI